jgi:uncharacterized protein (TIGR03382 family)
MIWTLILPALAVDRQTALEHAAEYTWHQWTMRSANITADCSSDYESAYSPGSYRGLPYDWGGYMSIEEFDAGLEDGDGAGSHSWHGILSCTVGLDCSGFVSMVWEEGHYSTSSLSAVTHNISVSDMLPTDAFNDPGSHITLYTHTTDAGQPVFYEAAGGAEKVRVNASGGWSYVDGYQPIRLDGISDELPTQGTAEEPYEISAFPFEHFSSTMGAPSDFIDVYSCDEEMGESGPEVLYHFVATSAGTLYVGLSDDSGTDIDVHVMTAANGASCLARDHYEVELEVGPGDVWISMDTWSDGDDEYPGPYLLTATFTGTVGESTGEDGGGDEGAGGDSGGADGGSADEGASEGEEDSAASDSSEADSGEPQTPKRGGAFPPGEAVAMDKTGGCSTAPAGAGWALGLLALVRRRRPRAQ